MVKCEICSKEIKNTELVKLKLSTGTIEVERELHKEMDCSSKIVIPNGFRLLTLFEFLEIWNEHKDSLDWGAERPDEVVKQPIKDIEKKYPYWNVWLFRLDCGSDFGGCGNLGDSNRVRGVRFVKDVKK